ncbi:MAG: hypothetical protein N4A47_03580 [Clostridia bacterium]|jgi:hypothetical protein|nr:hypothetical protein [Clostridia bacterium]
MENREIIEKLKIIIETKEYAELKEVSNELDIEFQNKELKDCIVKDPNIFLNIHRMSATVLDEKRVANIEYILATQESIRKIRENNKEFFEGLIEKLGGEITQETEDDNTEEESKETAE